MSRRSRPTSAPPSLPPLPPRWQNTQALLVLADQLAYRLLLQAPWPFATDTIEQDDAIGALSAAMPDHEDIEARVKALYAALPDGPAAEIWSALHGDLLAHTEECGYLLGLAIGARLGPHTLTAPTKERS